MSQPDLLTRLRSARPVAPPELRERIRSLAAEASPPRRRIGSNWRRALMVAVPVAAAAAAAAVLLPNGTRPTAVPARDTIEAQGAPATGSASSGAATDRAAPPTFQKTTAPAEGAPAVPVPSAARAQQYSASLELRLKDATAVSEATKRAVAIAGSLHGYLTSVDVQAGGRAGYANLVLRIPIERVRTAVTRLSALGTIVGEAVSIKDVQGQIDATSRKIARLKRLLASWQALPQTPDTIKHIDALTTQIGQLQRGRAATVRTTSYATVHLQLTSRPAPQPVRHGHGPLHRLGVIFRWAGIGAVYVLALGTPLAALFGLGWLMARSARRRREDRLLSSR